MRRGCGRDNIADDYLLGRTLGAAYNAHKLESGIDIPGDGEYSRHGFSSYIHERLTGLQPRLPDPGENLAGDLIEPRTFPEFYKQYDQHFRYLWMFPEISLDDTPNLIGTYERFRVIGPISYQGLPAVQRDIDNLKAALDGLETADAFLTAAATVGRKGDRDVLRVYPSLEAYYYAVADAMHEEYRAITDAGFILQVDFAALNPRGQILIEHQDATEQEIRNAIELGIEVVNHALREIPDERVRSHHCWGSMNPPHTLDVPLRQIIPMM